MNRFSRVLLTILIAAALTLGNFDVSAIAADNPQGHTSVESEGKSGENEDRHESGEKEDGNKSEEKEDGNKSEEKEDGNKSEEKEDGNKSEEKEDKSGKGEDQSGISGDESEKSGDSSAPSADGDTAKQEEAASEDGQKDTAKQEDSASESGQKGTAKQEEAASEDGQKDTAKQEDSASESGQKGTAKQEEAASEDGQKGTAKQEDSASESGQDSSAQKEEAVSEGGQEKDAKAEVTAPDASEKAAPEKSRKAAAGTDGEPAGESGNKAAGAETLEEAAASESVSEERKNEGESQAESGNDPVGAAAVNGQTVEVPVEGDVAVTNKSIPAVFSYSYGDSTQNTASSLDVTGNVSVEINERPAEDETWREGLPQDMADYIASILPEKSTDAGGIMNLAQAQPAEGNTTANGSVSSSVTVEGDVTVTGIDNSMGIHTGALGENSTATTEVKGDVTVSAGNQQGDEKDSTGIKAKTDHGGTVSVSIGGNLDVSSENNEAVVNGIIMNNESGSIEISVGGDLRSDGSGILSHGGSKSGESGQNTALVKGDVEAGGAGAVIVNKPAPDQTAVSDHDILVENVLAGNEVGVLVAEDRVEGLTGKDKEGNTVDVGGAVDITVWKIIPNERGNVAEVMSDTQGNPEKINPVSSGKAAENVEKAIKYIIKLEQPSEGGTLSVTDKDGKDLEKSHGHEVQRQDERVLLNVKVDAKNGYRIIGAYNGQGEKQELLMDSDGNYYIDVPKGGGVYLSVDLSNEYKVTFVDDEDNNNAVLQEGEVKYGETPTYEGDEPEKKATVKYEYSFAGWTPEINPVTGEITYTAVYDSAIRKYKLTFELAGGTLNGETGSFTTDEEYDSTVKLPTAPTREGYKFLYWKGSEYQPGDGYTVKGDHTFTAVWEKTEGGEEDDPTTPEENPTDPGEDPTDPEENPTDPEENPTDPEEDPTDPEEDPTDPEEDPTDPEEDPTDPEEDPTDPGEDKPSKEEEQKEKSNKESKEKSDKSEESGTYKSPKTGDESRPGFWILLAAAAGLGLVTILAGKRKSGRSGRS